MKLKSVFFTALFLFIILFVVHAHSISVEKINMTLVVVPSREIMVDKNLKIISVVSNTPTDVLPRVFLENEDGPELPFSDSIKNQYQSLKPSLNFLKIGYVYERSILTSIYISVNQLFSMINNIKNIFLKGNKNNFL